jgi:hypothetical protein
MIRTLKYALLGMGICLIMASFFSGPPHSTTEPEVDKPFAGGPNFVLEQGDELAKPVEDYTGEVINPDEETEDNEVLIVIPKGERGSDVAGILLEKGLIPDKAEFESKLIELELDRKIVYGTYRISREEPLKAIIEAITTGSI